MADVKLSAIASGGAYTAATDTLVSVRSGTTDVLTSLATLLGLTSVSTAGNDASKIKNIPTWVKVGAAIPFTTFQTAATSINVNLFSLIAGGVIHAVKIKQSAAFTGGAISAVTLSVGIAGTVAKYASAFDIFQAPGNTVFQLSNVAGSENNGATTQITATAVSTTANLSALTTGAVDIWALLSVAV